MSQSLVPEEVFLFPSASFSASYGIIKLVEAELGTGGLSVSSPVLNNTKKKKRRTGVYIFFKRSYPGLSLMKGKCL